MNARTRAVIERRRSGAAGPHGRRPTRAGELTAALEDYEDDLARPDDSQEETQP